MVTFSPADSVRLHELLSKRPDHFDALVGLVGVAIGAGIALVGQLLLSRREHARWLAGHFLTRKLDALTAFWIAVAEWHDVVVEKRSEWDAGKYDAAWADALAPFPSKCLRALRVVQPHLERDEFSTFKVLCDRMQTEAQQVLVNRTAPGFQQAEDVTRARERNRVGLEDAYKKAVEQMGSLFGRNVFKRT
jgi:hypothetical protein